MTSISICGYRPARAAHLAGCARRGAAALLLACATHLGAADGALDVALNGTGTTRIACFPDGTDYANHVALQADGRILVAGEADDGDGRTIAITRFGSDGAIDATFGPNHGTVLLPLGEDCTGAAVAVQSDGRIVVAGTRDPQSTGGGTILAVARLTGDGRLDRSFGRDGLAMGGIAEPGSVPFSVNALLIQPDGRIVVGGTTTMGNWILARVTAAGALDTTFNHVGHVAFPSGPVSGGVQETGPLAAIARQADGAIVMAGSAAPGLGWSVARVTAAGALDTGFNGTGITTTYAPGSAEAVAVLPTGGIVVAGYALGTDGLSHTLELLHLAGDGAHDPAFGSSGLTQATISPRLTPIGMTLLASPAGAVEVVESGLVGGVLGASLERYTSGGVLDTGFAGGKGFALATTPFLAHTACAWQPDGRVVLVGATQGGAGGENTTVARLTAAGALDTSFAGTGSLVRPLGSSEDAPLGTAVLADGRTLVLGSSGVQSGPDGTYPTHFMVARLLVDGSLDATFGSGGKARPTSPSLTAAVLGVQPGGRILVAGCTPTIGGSGLPPADLAVLRLNADGSLDTTFGRGGLVTTVLPRDPGVQSVDIAQALAVSANGDFTIACARQVGGATVVRYHEDGTLDTAFNGTGYRANPSIASYSSLHVAAQGDGRVLLLGSGYQGAAPALLLFRYLATGAPDTAFGDAGAAAATPGAVACDAGALALQPDGRILVSGTVNQGAGDRIAILRFTAAGALDTRFAGGGTFLSDFGYPSGDGGTTYDMSQQLAVQDDGRILIATASLRGPVSDFSQTIARLNADGSVDAGFGSGGRAVTRGPDQPAAIALGPATLTVVGRGDGDIAVTRYLVGSASTHPSATASAQSLVAKQAPITIALTFSAPVTGLGSAGLLVHNATVQAVSGAGTAWSATLRPTNPGAVGCQVAANAATSAAGQGNAASNTVTVMYDPTPAITAQPADAVVTVGATASFAVAVTGTGPFTCTWRKNGAAIAGAGATTYTTPVTLAGDSGGAYSVVVANAFGNATSRDAALTVLPPANGTGLAAAYFANQALSGAPALTRIDPTVAFAWGAGAPAAALPVDHFSARWTGQVQARAAGTYTFTTTSDDGVRLWIDGKPVIDHWTVHGASADSGQATLQAGGLYAVTMEYFEGTGQATAKLAWAGPGFATETIPVGQLYPFLPAGGGSGLRGDYFANQTLSGTPALTRTDAGIDFAWGAGAPAPGLPVDHVSVRWSGTVTARVSGPHTFTTLSDDGVRLWVDGQLLVDNWTPHGPTSNTGTILLSAGAGYAITMEYFENTGGATARLSWSAPGLPAAIVPAAQLTPPPAALAARPVAGRTFATESARR